MRLIAHRGLMYGPNKEIENHPDTIEEAWANDFDCEIDIWRCDGKWFLGHDKPTYEVPSHFLMMGRSWFHCKNFEALDRLSTHSKGINFFWHQDDNYTLTSFGYVWAYPGQPVGKNTIYVLPEQVMKPADVKNLECFGVCSDYVIDIRESLK